MDDLIQKIREEIDKDERLANGTDEQAHNERHWPDRVLAMAEAHRAILAEHAEGDDGSCLGCGANYCEEPRVSNINDCETLLALAKGYGIGVSKHG